MNPFDFFCLKKDTNWFAKDLSDEKGSSHGPYQGHVEAPAIGSLGKGCCQ